MPLLIFLLTVLAICIGIEVRHWRKLHRYPGWNWEKRLKERRKGKGVN